MTRARRPPSTLPVPGTSCLLILLAALCVTWIPLSDALPGPGGPSGSPQASCGTGQVLLETTRGSHACVEEGRADVLVSRGFEPAPWTASYPYMASPSRVAEPRGLAAENNGFAMEMYRVLAGDGGNVFFSPISLYLAFSALHEGAASDTREEIRRAFGLEMDAGDRREEARDLVTRIEAWALHKSLTVRSFVQVYGDPAPGAGPLVDDVRGAYRTDIQFYGDPGGSAWEYGGESALAEFATDGAITGILPRDGSTPAGLLVSSPAYLAAGWDVWFPGDAAYHAHWTGDVRTVRTEGPRGVEGLAYNEHRPGGANDSAPLEFMRQPECACWHRDIGDGEVLWLPLGGGLSMLAVIPGAGADLASVEAGLDAGDLAGLMSGLRPEKIDLYVPRFSAESHTDMRGPLGDLGVSAAFDKRSASLGGIAPGMHVDRVIQKAVMDTDRKGVHDPPDMSWIRGDGELVMDRPFMFAVLDDATGAVLFMGRMAEPAAGVVTTFGN